MYMTLQYSELSSPPSVLNVPPGGTYANPLSGTDTNYSNIPTSQIQSVSGAAVHRGGGAKRRKRSHRRKHTRKGGFLEPRRRRRTRRHK